MLLLLLILIVLFVAAPLDAQYAAVEVLRQVWLHPLAPYFVAGALGALVVILAGYNAIWNALAYRIYLDDVSKAEDTYKRRKR
jgi:hypothetical protein